MSKVAQKDVLVFALEPRHDGHGGGAALGVAHEDDFGALGRAADMFEVGLHGQGHVDDALRGAERVHVRVDAVRRDAESDVVGLEHGVALAGQDALDREGFGGRLTVGADGEVADDDHVLDPSACGQDQLAGLDERGAVQVVPLEGAGDLDDLVAVEAAEQVARKGHGIGLGRLRACVGGGGRAVLVHQLDLGVDQPVFVEEFRGLDGQHLEGVEIGVFQRRLAAGAEQDAGQYKYEYCALFHHLTKYSLH